MRIQLASIVLALSCSPAFAGTVSFSASYSNQNPPAALAGRCAPAARTVTFGPGIAPVSGNSNLGVFTPSGSHCINPPLPISYSDGVFSFDFGSGDLLIGTYTGTLAATRILQTFSNVQNYVVTGGAGRFVNATGTFQGLGSVTFVPGSLPSSFQTLSGTISAPGVPEMSTWLMMLAGFGLIGGSIRAIKRQEKHATT